MNTETLRTNNHRAQRRIQAKNYLGAKCRFCSSIDNLEFDHIDPKTKSFNISDAISNNKAWTKLVLELDKCQLLCHDCHKEKSDEEQSVNHGEGLTGKKNCSCDLCKPLKQKYMKNYTKQNQGLII